MKKSLQVLKDNRLSVFILFMSEKAFGQKDSTIGGAGTITSGSSSGRTRGKMSILQSALFFTVFSVFCANVSSQTISSYTFSSTAGTYTAVAGTTISTITWDDDNTPAVLPIGFAFNFGGTIFTDFGVNNNGWIQLGSNPTSSYTPISTFATNNIIAPFARDLQGQAGSSIQYITTGSAPNRVLTVQWTNYRRYGGTGQSYNFQIKLYETSNVVEFVYGTITPNSTSTSSLTVGNQVGIRNAGGFSNRSTTTNWAASVAGTLATSSCIANNTVKPISGLTYAWTPPPPCSGAPNTPLASTTIVAPICGQSIVLTATGMSTAVSGISNQWQVSSTPGGPYTNVVGGTGATSGSYTTASLLGGNYYYVLASTCTNTSTTTLSNELPIQILATPSTPIFAATSGQSTTGFTANWGAAAGATSYILDVSTSNTFATFVPGFSALNVGNVTTYAVTGLTPNTNYYFRVRATNGSCETPNATTQNMYTGYCIPTSNCSYGDVIASVVLNTLSNVTGTACATLAPTGYSNFTGNPALTTTLLPSSSYTITVGANAYAQSVAVWIDYNDDLIFDNVTERVGNTLAASPIPVNGTASFTITMGCTPPAGVHRMRIRSSDNSFVNGPAQTPCTNYSYGETEDYLITVAAAPACPSPSSLTCTGVTSTSASLTWLLGCSNATNYDFEYGPAGFIPGTGTVLTNQVATIAAGSGSYTLTGLTASTSYDVYFRANCGGSLSAWSPAVNVYTGHCIPSSTNILYWLSNVTTTGGLTNFNNTSALSVNGYGDYTASQSVSAVAGTSFNLSANYNVSSYYYFAKVWVDWNNDLDFNDIGETMYTTPLGSFTMPFSASLTVPAGQANGNYRMRVRLDLGNSYIDGLLDPCGTFTYGETEDYTLTVVPNCSAAPTPPLAALTGTTPFCYGLTTAMTASGITLEGGISNQWLYSTTPGGPYTNFAGATNDAYTTSTTLIPNTYYTVFNSTCTLTNQTTSSNEITFTVDGASSNFSLVPASFCGVGGNSVLTANPTVPGAIYTWSNNGGTLSTLAGDNTLASLTQTSEFTLNASLNGCVSQTTQSIGVYPLPSATVTTSASGVCPGTSATINSGLSSSNFTVSSIPYDPYTIPTYATTICSDGVPLVPLSGGGLDDGGWGNIPIGFNFNFFGTNFSTLAAGTNGLLMFGAVPGYGTAAGQLGQFSFNGGPVGGSYQYFPNPSNPGNVISLMAGDQYFGSGTNGSATSDLIYWTSGFAPNRVFNILYQDVNRCCGVANPAFTAYAKLFETIGTVEIHILNNNQSAYSNVVGLQDATQTIGAVAPGRPTQNQTSGAPTPWGVAIPEAWKFVPPANYTTVWTATNSVGTTTIANGTNIFSQAVAPLETTTYDISYTNQTTGCTNAVGSANVQMIIFSNIAPVGVNTVAPVGECDGVNFLLSTDYVGTLNGIAFQWQVSIDGGLTYNDILGATATTYNVNQSITSMYRLQMIACSGTPSYSNPSTVINYALPVIGVTPNSAPFCQPGGTAVAMNASGGLTYSWAPASGLSSTSGSSVNASPSATTVYTVTGTDVNGCNSVATATILLSSSITLTNTGATPASVCPGGNSVLATTGSLASTAYCQPTANCNFGDMITDVTFSSINNTTVCSGIGGFNLNTTANPTVNAGASIPLFVATGPAYEEGVAVWIDYNKNGTFEASELVLDGYLGTAGATYAGTVLIPANATNGTTRMRVRCMWLDNPNAIGPCANASYGETEDYLITIVGGLDPISYAWTPNTNLGSVIGASVNASNVLTPETYTVTATSSEGCTATATATINVFALPTVSAGLDQSICTGSPATLSGSGAVTYTWNNGVTNNVAFTPTSNTTYTVIGVDANGCSNVDDMNITMLALPTVNAGIDQAICLNASTSVTASGAVTYTWNNNVVNGVTFSPTSTATYTVVGVGANGCLNQDNMVIVVNPLPSVNAGPNYTVCEGQNITLIANTNGGSITWNNNVINGFPFTPSVGSTTYTVTASNGFGCTNMDSTIVVVNPTPSVSVSANQTACVGSPVVFTATVSSSPSGSWTTNGSGTIAPNVTNNSVTYTPSTNDAGLVYISYAAFNSCGITTDTATIIVNGVPTVAAGMDMTICSGESILLSGTGATTYTWNNGAVDNVTFVPTISGIYTVVGADTNGCTDTDDVLVTINQTPNATSTAIDPVTLVATPSGENYQWIDCATGLSIADATSDTLIALVNGDYAVVVSSSNGCSDTSNCITVDQVGLYMPTSLIISVYPNPTNGNVSISLPSNDQGVLSIYDAQGKLVQTTNSLKNGDVINLSTYTPGMYTFKIAFGDMIHIERVIKN